MEISEKLRSLERFKGKRALVMGLGLWQGGVEAVKFLHRWGASEILVTDLRDEKTLAPSLEAIKHIPVTLRLGEHQEADFRRAQVVIHSPAVRPDNKYLEAARKAGAEVTQEMTLFIEACPAGTIIGITGSNGKTTTTALVYEIFCQVYERAQPELAGKWAEPCKPEEMAPLENGDSRDRVWLGGNIGTPLINRLEEIDFLDPVILELSSFQLMDWHRIKKSATCGTITNITPNHLDWHRDFEEYARSKQAVFEYWDEYGDVPRAILNADDPVTAEIAARNPGRFRLFSIKRGIGAEHLLPGRGEIYASGTDGELRLCYPSNSAWAAVSGKCFARREDLRLPGEFNWANAVAAGALAGYTLNPEHLPCIKQGLRRFRGVEHRLEPCGTVNRALVYNDSIATDPAATMAALSAFDKGVHLILGGGSKNIDYTELGKRIATHGGIKAIYLQGTTARAIKAAVGAQHAVPLHECATFDEACGLAFKALQPGDVLLMSPASTSFYEYAPGKKFANFEERGKHFKTLVVDFAKA